MMLRRHSIGPVSGVLCQAQLLHPDPSCVAIAQGTSGQEGSHATAGFGGGGATAFPAESLGKDLQGEHLSDFEKVTLREQGKCTS